MLKQQRARTTDGRPAIIRELYLRQNDGVPNSSACSVFAAGDARGEPVKSLAKQGNACQANPKNLVALVPDYDFANV